MLNAVMLVKMRLKKYIYDFLAKKDDFFVQSGLFSHEMLQSLRLCRFIYTAVNVLQNKQLI